jgi:hypothetical protein
MTLIFNLENIPEKPISKGLERPSTKNTTTLCTSWSVGIVGDEVRMRLEGTFHHPSGPSPMNDAWRGFWFSGEDVFGPGDWETAV